MKRTSTGTTYNISNFVRPENASFSSFCILLFWRYLHYERKKRIGWTKTLKTLITITPCTLKENIAQMLFKIPKGYFSHKKCSFFWLLFLPFKKEAYRMTGSNFSRLQFSSACKALWVMTYNGCRTQFAVFVENNKLCVVTCRSDRDDYLALSAWA